MLYFDGLSKTFHSKNGAVTALNKATFQVKPGQIMGFAGSNGAGKSTAMRIALDLLKPDSGQVTWQRKPLSQKLRERIGYMPEERGLYPKMKVSEQLVYLARLHGASVTEAQQAMSQWIDRLGLASRREDLVEKLSLGNQQRVQLAAALVHHPDILILDEPFSGLDPVAVQVMSSVLKEQAAQGVTILFSSHQLDLVQEICDAATVIVKGEVVATDTVPNLRRTATPQYLLRFNDRAGTARSKQEYQQLSQKLRQLVPSFTDFLVTSDSFGWKIQASYQSPTVQSSFNPQISETRGANKTVRSNNTPVALAASVAKAAEDWDKDQNWSEDPGQELLWAANRLAPVAEFSLYRPSLTEVFTNLVSEEPAEDETPIVNKTRWTKLFKKGK